MAGCGECRRLSGTHTAASRSTSRRRWRRARCRSPSGGDLVVAEGLQLLDGDRCSVKGDCQPSRPRGGATDPLHRIDLAYAITVHKAQGSQFTRVIVPVVRSRLLDRTLIYTALTRGIEQVVFIGDRDAFDAAVMAPPRSHERQVGFSV
ncbi:MAG TPA: ATP-dependent RecD-like DNA helicase [Bryobacteraceae bacterium]